ncbi:MAG: dTMP kinase [Bacilli bacterium]|nr:dTMP kinase [Bacilli bacterium]
MKKGKLIVIEGTDSSGKETQAKALVKNLSANNIKAAYYSFPNYNTPTGKIIAGPYLGKEAVCSGWFEEGASNVDPMVASLYYAADRKYNINDIKDLLRKGYNVILDRYCDSNMAHQAGKEENIKKRNKLYKNLEKLEYGILKLIKPDFTIFLHLPYQYSKRALEIRLEIPDQHEASLEHLKKAELAYLEIAQMHDYITVECVKDEGRKTVEELETEIYNIVKDKIQ